MTNLCLALKYEHPDDPMPMTCALGLNHGGDHAPTRYDGGYYTTWSDEEAAS